MKRSIISAVAAVAFLGALFTATEQAQANPALIFGVVAWKVVALVSVGVLGGILLSRTHGPAFAATPQTVLCPVHHRADGTAFVRANCT